MQKDSNKIITDNPSNIKEYQHGENALYGQYVPWHDISTIDWARIMRIHLVNPSDAGILKNGCYVSAEQHALQLIAPTSEQILNILSMCSTNLEVLELSYAPIYEIPDRIRDLKSLRFLGLGGLKLTSLPDWLPDLGLSFTRSARNNCISLCETTVDGIDMSIFDQPQEVILQWFEARKDTSVPMRELRVIFLGDGDAGKSHIISRLMKDGEQASVFPAAAAPGIKINNKQYRIDNEDVLVHFWDFGGQEILHALHRLFLTKRTLYVVVLNVRDGNQDDRARYWLYTLNHYAFGAPVLLVLNKMDMHLNASVNETELRMLCPGLTNIVKLSAKEYSSKEFKSEFIDILMQQIRSMHILPMLKSWSQLINAFRNTNKNYIHSDDFQRLCDKYHIAQDQIIRQELLNLFSDLGISLSYRESMNLGDYIILRPDWILNAVSSILWNLRESNNGIVPHNSIYHLLADKNRPFSRNKAVTDYSSNEVNYILHVMRHFSLSFRVNDDNEFIPSLCNHACSPIVDDYMRDPETLQFRIDYDYLPTRAVHMLMLDRLQDLDFDHVWFTGARFFTGSLGLSAVVNAVGNQLRICVRSQNRMHSAYTYLEMIRNALDRINKQLGLRVTQNQVVYKADGITELFDYDELLERMKYGTTKIRSKKRRKVIDIQDILRQTGSQERSEKQQLIRDILDTCCKIQNHQLFRNVSEDARCNYLGDQLRAREYIVMDQSRAASSDFSRHVGELDLDIRRDPGIPWAICEVMNSKGDAQTRIFEMHTRMLLNSFRNESLAFLICFLECAKDKFHVVCETYLSALRNRSGFYAPVNCYPISPEQDFGMDCRFIAASQCIYDQGGLPCEVVHIFVHIGE